MRSFPKILLACSALILSSLAPARGSVSSALDAYPDCAKSCILEAFQKGACGFGDQECVCDHPGFGANVSICVGFVCPIPDALVTLNTSRAACGQELRDQSHGIVVISDAVGVVAALFVILRFGYKLLISKVRLERDDWLVLMTMISLVPSLVITAHGSTANGLGRDIWTLPAEKITNVGKFFYMTVILYFWSSMFVKLCFITFYLRIFPTRRVQYILWGTFILTVLWGLGFVLFGIFQCQPIQFFWEKWDGMHTGQCANANTVGWANAASGIALDVWILAIPLWQLRKLQLHWKQKISVAVMFLVGAFVTVISILRLRSLVDFAKTSNVTWEYSDVTIWSMIEIAVGIMCACLPTIRLLLVRIFPQMDVTQQQSQGLSYRYGSGGHSRTQTATGNIAQVITSGSRSGHRLPESLSGIVLQKAFSVHVTEMEEEDLVALRDLGSSGDRDRDRRRDSEIFSMETKPAEGKCSI